MIRNISEPLRGDRQTNQRAELTAVARALDHVPIDRAVLIHTDSNYSIQCLTKWFQNWEKNNWRSSSGKAVENKDLIEPIIARIRERDMCRARTDFKWIKGHANDPGNTAADLLAVQGSRYSTPDLRSENIKDISATLNTPTTNDYGVWTKPDSNPEDVDKAYQTLGDDEKTALANDDDGAEYDKLFADLAAERSAETDTVGLSIHDHVPPSFAVNQLAKAGAREGQEQLNEVVNGEPPSPKIDAMDVVEEKAERT